MHLNYILKIGFRLTDVKSAYNRSLAVVEPAGPGSPLRDRVFRHPHFVPHTYGARVSPRAVVDEGAHRPVVSRLQG